MNQIFLEYSSSSIARELYVVIDFRVEGGVARLTKYENVWECTPHEKDAEGDLCLAASAFATKVAEVLPPAAAAPYLSISLRDRDGVVSFPVRGFSLSGANKTHLKFDIRDPFTDSVVSPEAQDLVDAVRRCVGAPR